MAHVAPIYPSFSKGEVSPLMFGRIDIEQYNTCLDKCRNMWVRPYGSVSRLTGTEYISNAKNNGKARLLKFVFSADDSLIIECGAGYFRFYKDGKLVLIDTADEWLTGTDYKAGDYVQLGEQIFKCITDHKSTTWKDDAKIYWEYKEIHDVYEVANDYQVEQLDSIQYVQLDDVIKLTCLPVGDDYSTAKPKELIRKGLLKWEFKNVEFVETPYLDQNISDITLTPSAATGESITIKASGELFNAKHKGAMFWIGLKVTDADSNEDVQGYVQITEVTDSKNVKAKVLSKLSGTSATKIWGEGAFSDYRGYPSCVALYDGRLYYARTPHQPRNIYGSVPYAYETFTPAVNNEDDGAINVQLATNANGDGSDIKWLIGASYLLCGTYGGEFVVRGTGDGAITPTDISARQRTNWGGEPVRPIVAGSFVHFLQRTGKKLRQFQYDYYYDSYKAVDLSIYSEHLLSSPIKEMAYQKSPDSIIYLVREDGQVVMLSLEQDQSVMAWSLLEEMSGEVESIETIPAKDGLFDEVWLLMKRRALATTLDITSTIEEDRIKNNYSKTKANIGTEIIKLSRTGSSVYGGYLGNDGDYYISNGYLYNRLDNLVDAECGWTKISFDYGIKNGALYLLNVNTCTLFNDDYNWQEISGFSSTTFPYLGIADGKLYLVGETSDSIELIDDTNNWTKIVNYNTSNISDYFKYGIADGKLFYIKLDKTIKQIGTATNWTHITADNKGDGTEYSYGISGGSLYRLNGATATKVGSLNTWTDIFGVSNDNEAAIGIADGVLYSIKNTTVTSLAGNQNLKFTKVYGNLSLYSSTPNYYAVAIGNNNIYSIALSSSGTKQVKAITTGEEYTDIWGYLPTNTNKTYCYAVKKDGNLYKIYLNGTAEFVSPAIALWIDTNNKVYDLEKEFNISISGEIKYTDTLTITIETNDLGFKRYIERMRNPITTENPLDWWYVRSGEKFNAYNLTKDIDLTISIDDGYVLTATTSKDYFTEDMLNRTIREVDSDYNVINEYIITEIKSSTEAILITKGIVKDIVIKGGLWGVGVTSLNGFERLNQLEVQIYADGLAQENKTVENGIVNLDNEGFIVLVGLPYQSYMTTMPLEQGSQNGTAVGKRKRIGELAIRVWNSQGVRYGRDLDNLYETIQNQTEPYTGIIPNIKYNQGWGWTANITLEQSKPYPMNVLAIAPIVTEVDK